MNAAVSSTAFVGGMRARLRACVRVCPPVTVLRVPLSVRLSVRAYVYTTICLYVVNNRHDARVHTTHTSKIIFAGISRHLVESGVETTLSVVYPGFVSRLQRDHGQA